MTAITSFLLISLIGANAIGPGDHTLTLMVGALERHYIAHGGKGGSEVVLIEIVGGRHTWPSGPSKVRFLGKTTMNISANDAMWEFFQKHPMK